MDRNIIVAIALVLLVMGGFSVYRQVLKAEQGSLGYCRGDGMMEILVDGTPHCAVLDHPTASCEPDSILVLFRSGELMCAHGHITAKDGQPLPGYDAGPKAPVILISFRPYVRALGASSHTSARKALRMIVLHSLA